MELLFPNYERSNDWNVGTAVGCLSLCQGEEEGEGSFTARWKCAHLNPSPQSAPRVTRGEAIRTARWLPRSQTKCPWRVAFNENRCDR